MSQRQYPEALSGNDILAKVDLKALVYPLWSNKWLIASVIGICLTLGILFCIVKTPLYSSSILLQVEDRNSSFLALDKNSFSSSLFSAQSASPAEIQTALIESRYILEPVIQQLHLDMDVTPVYFPFFGQWYARTHAQTLHKPWWGSSRFAWGDEKIEVAQFVVPPSLEEQRFTLKAGSNHGYRLYDAENQFILAGKVGEISTSVFPGQGLITLQVQRLQANPNTRFYIVKRSTQRMVDELAQQLQLIDLSQITHLRDDTGILKISLIGAQPQYIVNILNTIAKIVVDKNTAKKLTETTKTIDFINREIPATKKSLNQAETKLNLYLAKNGMIDLSSASKLVLAQITDVQRNLEDLQVSKTVASQKYTPLHPFFIALNERERTLNQELGALQKEASQLPAHDQVAVELMRDVRVKDQLYLALLNKIQSLKLIKGGAVSDVTVLGLATFPNFPLPKGSSTILLFSMLVGFILGAAIVYVNQIWNSKVFDPMLIETQFGLTNMAIIPFSDKQKNLLIAFNPKFSLIPLLAKSDPKDLSIEALRSFRTSAQFAMMEATSNILTITSVAPAAGKSFVSVNFSYLQADIGKKVLLIDGDLRKGHLRDYFKVGKPVGLTEVLTGQSTFEEALIHGPCDHLDFLATGDYPSNPSELLMSLRFKELLDNVSKQYDLIIIDTPPILAVTDATIMARYAGANFLVLASNAHEPEEIELALKRFHSNGIAISGVVFNFQKQQTGIYRRDQTYQYQYEYSA